MKIVSINIGDLQKNEPSFLSWLYASGAEVVCVQDTVTPSYKLSNELQYPKNDYQAYYFDTATSGTGGVAIFTKILPKAIIYGMGFEEADSQGRYMQADFDQVSVACFSFPKDIDFNIRENYKDNFYNFAKKVARKRREYILCGALNMAHTNLDVAKWQTSGGMSGFTQEDRIYCDTLFKLNFVDIYRYMNKNGADYTFYPNADKGKLNADAWRTNYQLASNLMAKNVLRAWIENSKDFAYANPLWAEYNI